jgi:hypothetical protein
MLSFLSVEDFGIFRSVNVIHLDLLDVIIFHDINIIINIIILTCHILYL